MSWKRGPMLATLVAAAALALLALRGLGSADDWLVEYPLPIQETHRLFDIGVVDANGDDWLDIYTSNHHFRQLLLLADGQGGYRDVLSDWGLDQSREFPRAELSYSEPATEQPGLYVYWLGTNLVLRVHRHADLGVWTGVLKVRDPVEIVKNDGFEVQKQDQETGVAETVVTFAPTRDGRLVLKPGGQGLPLEFSLTGTIQPRQIFVGRAAVSPRATAFSLTMRDRHAMAWADYNADGVPDVFINRGALSGTLIAYPASIQQQIRDELLLSQGSGRFEEAGDALGIRKNGCSGRHARWVDFNADGLLDLFVNCYDREHVQGEFPKQLYQQVEDRKLEDVASRVGLGLPDRQMGAFAWLDVDDDGKVDLLTLEDSGLYMYRNREGRFSPEEVYPFAQADAPQIGQAGDSSWFYDGVFSLTDFDADGDLDVFFASKRGNVLLRNADGRLLPVAPGSVGLPAASSVAAWVDYDNDGAPDLHLVPQGIFRQEDPQRFRATGALELPAGQYDAAIVNWADLDNDGRQDVLLALKPNRSFKPWWQWSAPQRQRGEWQLLAYRNTRKTDHWLQVRLVGAPGNRDAIGARLTVVTPHGRQVKEVGTHDSSFFSQGHYRMYFGLGNHAKADQVTIRWPDGSLQDLLSVVGNRLLVLRHPSSLKSVPGQS